jgi:hypothetical protein
MQEKEKLYFGIVSDTTKQSFRTLKVIMVSIDDIACVSSTLFERNSNQYYFLRVRQSFLKHTFYLVKLECDGSL